MISEQEENIDQVDDPNATSSSAETNPSPEKKDNGLNEHAKPRRRRRGKKRKHRRESAATCEAAENHKHCGGELHVEHDRMADCGGDSVAWNSDENLSCDVPAFSDIIIRPLDVPKAPENSTQFIMDDHNDCHFYLSFETPNPYMTDPAHPVEKGDIVEPPEEDAAYRDIDYQYESPQDFDNTAYYDREFELSYKNNRFDELMRLSRNELTGALQGFEIRLKELSDELGKENPSSILEKLQAQLLDLQEKNISLKECNTKMSSTLPKEVPDAPCNDGITPEDKPETVSLVPDGNREFTDIGETQCADSSKDIAMTDISAPICDKKFDTPPEPGYGRSVYKQPRLEKRSSVKISFEKSSSDVEQTGLNLNSRILQHCQPSSIILNDDIRTLSISSASDIFHAKCSSSVPIEGGMSPSETSVN